MKKASTLLLLLFSLHLLFGNSPSIVTLRAVIPENIHNSQVKVVDGCYDIDFTNASHYDNLLSSLDKHTQIVVTSNGSSQTVEGCFTVFVRRLAFTRITVTVTTSPMQMVNGKAYYLPYSISYGDTELLSTIDDPSQPPVKQITYNASTLLGGVRDATVFTYNIYIDNTASIGDYEATVSFTITVQ